MKYRVAINESGYFIDYKTGKVFDINEHEDWLRRVGVKFLPQEVVEKFDDFKPKWDREELILFVMKNTSLIRVRGHGGHTTFEFDGPNRRALEAIWHFLEDRNADPYDDIMIFNFRTGKKLRTNYQEFEEAMLDNAVPRLMRASENFTVKPEYNNVEIIESLVEIAEDVIC